MNTENFEDKLGPALKAKLAEAAAAVDKGEGVPVVRRKRVPRSAPAVVGNGATDEVKISAMVLKNKLHKKSLTIHHLQRRLNEWGYTDAFSDRDGWYGEPTYFSVFEFQKDHGMIPTGLVDMETAQKIFEGDPNVTVVP